MRHQWDGASVTGGDVGGGKTNAKAHKLRYTVRTPPIGWENPNSGGHVKLGAITEVFASYSGTVGGVVRRKDKLKLEIDDTGAHSARACALRKSSS